MAAVADRVIVELEAKLDRYSANVRAAEQRFSAATASIQRNSSRMAESIRQNSTAAGASIRNLAATFAAAFTAQRVIALADGYTRFTNQLQLAGQQGDQLARTQQQLFEIAQRNGVQLESLGTLYGRLSQGSRELGATSADLLRFTSGVAAALRIQGTSAEESRGALLQLTQALGGSIVRAEEFNSINEGARPILQAVANNIDRFGGSVARLRTAVIAGRVTSAEFFQAFLRGSAQLEAQSQRATLTIGNSFTVLNNALGMYIGQADDGLSATERLSAAIITLSENLDTVANALGVIGAILLGRWVSGLVGAAAATGVVSSALFAMRAAAVGAATGLEAMAFAGAAAGRGLLAAFGGPVGLTVAALSVAIYYLATQTDAAAQASESYAQAQDRLREVTGQTHDAIERVAAATGRARAEALANARALREQTIQYLATARAALIAATAVAQQRRTELQLAEERTRVAANDPRLIPGIGRQQAEDDLRQASTDLRASTAIVQQAQRNLADLDQVIHNPPPVRAAAPAAAGHHARGRHPSGPDAADIERRFLDDMDRGRLEFESAMADIENTIDARRTLERSRIGTERDMADRAVRADDNYSRAQKAQLLELNERIFRARIAASRAEETEQNNADALALAVAGITNQHDLLQFQSRLADTTRDRRDAELRLLDLQYEQERLQLENVANNVRLNDTEREIARRRLAALEGLHNAERQGVERQYEGAGARYLRGLRSSDINEQLDEVRVRGLGRLEDALTDTIGKIFEMGGAFGQVANQIISDLIRIGVQRAIIEPLAGALFGGKGGGGGIGSFFGALFGGGGGGGSVGGAASGVAALAGSLFGGFGKASGGHVSAGMLYRVNERPGGVEGFKPAGSGQIVPLGQMRAATAIEGGGGGPVVHMPVSVVAPGANAQTVELIRQTIADAAPTLIQAAQRATVRQITRPRLTR